jgi:hypothetical protein
MWSLSIADVGVGSDDEGTSVGSSLHLQCYNCYKQFLLWPDNAILGLTIASYGYD